MPDLKTGLSVGEMVANGYRILGMAGAGGMGVVYRALDTKLERTVALKFLPADLNASERDKQRILREARTASSLDHPNIGVIHGIEETADGRTFIVMAFYEGQSLAQKIRSGPIPPGEAVEIALQMARGLAEAHARHIVHRDIKPSNVMLTNSGSVRIVDFGLAHAATGQTASQTGMTGTVSYMSPEQTLGNAVDQRSDLWALGLVLAEMLTGQNPMERESIPGIVMAILNEAPRGLETAPEPLQPILYRALSKQPGKRYQHCTEMIADLEQVRSLPEISGAPAAGAPAGVAPPNRRTRQNSQVSKLMAEASRSAWNPTPVRRGPPAWVIAVLCVLLAAALLLLVPAVRQRVVAVIPGATEMHVAVLPFENIGSNPENDVVVQGLMDSMAGKLSNLDAGDKSLWVVPTSEVRRRKITDPEKALKELGATLVVEGTVQRQGQAVHMNVSLIDTKHMRQVGSAEVEDQAGDLSTLQNEAVSRLAKLMAINVSPDMLKTTGGEGNPIAYEDYLKALGYMQRYDKAGNLDDAIAALRRSIKTDPRFALAYAELGDAYREKYQIDKNPNWLNEALANSKKALELDSRMPSAYVTLGKLHDTSGQHDLALSEFQRALDLDAKNPDALSGLAGAYEHAGRLKDAEASFQMAIALRPDSWNGYNNLALFYDRQNRFAESREQLLKAIKMTPDNAQLYLNLAAVDLDTGDTKLQADAEQSLKKSLALNPGYAAYANLGLLYQNEKRYAEAAAVTEKALAIDANNYLVWNNLESDYLFLQNEQGAARAQARAKELAEQEVRLNPQAADVVARLAAYYAHDKENEQALSHVRTALALAPRDPTVLSSVGEAYELMGDRQKAIEYLHQALSKGFPMDQIATDPELQSLIKDPHFTANLPSPKK